MKRTIRQSANVLPGGRIELSVPDIPVGTSVDVTLDVELAQGDGKPLFVGMFSDEPGSWTNSWSKSIDFGRHRRGLTMSA